MGKIPRFLAIFLYKCGCHANSLGDLENLGSIFEFAVPNNKFLDFLHITEISALFCLNLVAMTTP